MFFDRSLINLAIGAPSITSWSTRIVILSISLIATDLSTATGLEVTELIPKQQKHR